MRFDDLKAAILSQYDMAETSTDSFVTTDALDAFCNRALRRYYALLTECAVDHYNELQVTSTTSAGVALTSLPTRFRRLGSIVWQRGTDDLVTLEPARPDDEWLIGYSAQGWDAWLPRFKMAGATIQWLPAPLSTETVYITYSATPGDLSADADAFEAGDGWEQFVIADVCVMLGSKEERSLQAWVAMREEAREAIMTQAPLRGDTRTGGLLLDTQSAYASDWDLRNRLTVGGF